MFGVVLLVHCGYTRASVKTASMSKQRKLPTYWFVLVGDKGIIGSSHMCSYCGYFKVWSTNKAVVEIDIPWIVHVEPCLSMEYTISVCTPLTTAADVFL